MFDLIFVKGGFVMYFIVGLSIYMLAVILFKAYQFLSSGMLNTRYIDPVMLRVKKGELTDAARMLERERGPVARIMRVAIECIMNREITMKSRESEIARVGAAELRYLESHLRGLEMTSTVAPLLGLMGTVIGMIDSFTTLSEAGSRVDPSMLAGGIWVALITTVGGLLVAVPALAAYYIIDAQIERVRATMRDVTIQILALEDMFIRNEKEQEKRDAIEREDRLRAMAEVREKAIEITAAAATGSRTAPQSSSVLRLLSPSYNKF
jgi:biopolymer transport protein ExbB